MPCLVTSPPKTRTPTAPSKSNYPQAKCYIVSKLLVRTSFLLQTIHDSNGRGTLDGNKIHVACRSKELSVKHWAHSGIRMFRAYYRGEPLLPGEMIQTWLQRVVVKVAGSPPRLLHGSATRMNSTSRLPLICARRWPSSDRPGRCAP